MCLFSVAASKTLRLEEFEQAQAAATDAAANHLRDNWLAAIRHIIKCARRARHLNRCTGTRCSVLA